METESKIEAIERRMAALERTARRWQLVAVVAVAAAVCCFGMAADDPFPKMIKTNLLVIEDENGNRGGVFGYTAAGREIMFGLGGRDRKSLTDLLPGVPAVHVVTPEGKTVLIE